MSIPLEDQLPELFNMRLQDVIKRKDLVDIRLATDAEMDSLRGEIPEARIKGTIRQWHLVAVESRGRFTSATVLGYYDRTRRPYHTSEVAALDEARGLVRTLNSVYHLEERAEGDVPIDLVWTACAMFSPTAQRILGIPAITF